MPFDPTAARPGSIFSDVPNYQAAWICYINGIEVPILGFQTNCQIWQVPSFTIHCVPDPVIQRLGTEDRVPVQIFYLDDWASDKPTFRLLIDGEIVGWSFSSSTGARSIAFSCLSHIQIFQQLYFFYMTNVDDIVMSRSPEIQASGFATPGLLYPYAIFHQGLMSTGAQRAVESPVYDERGNAVASPAQGPTTTTASETEDDTAPILCAYELVTNVIKGVISSKVPEDRRAVPMMNFFARHIRKTRFHNRWVRLPLLEDAAALNDRKGVFPIFNAARNDQALIAMQRQVVSQVGSSGPVWNLFQQVLGLVYMEIAMIPNPACVQVKLAPLAPNQPEEGKILRPFYDSEPLTTLRRGLNTTGDSDTDPIRRQAEANVGASAGLRQPGQTTLPSFLADLDSQPLFRPEDQTTPTQTQIPGTVTLDSNGQPVIVPDLNQAAPDFRTNTSFTPPPVGSGVRETSEQRAAREAGSANTRTEQERTAAVEQEYQRLVAARTQELAAQDARDISIAPPVEPIRLAQYFVKPNFFFGEVPSCNVILPSMIDSWTYDESYINQPTRVYVNDSVMTRSLRATGPNREFMLHALTVGWPEEANALMHHRIGSETGENGAAGGAASGAESGRNLLVWPEEFYKGPVTARFEIPAWFQMLQQFANRETNRGRPSVSQPTTPASSTAVNIFATPDQIAQARERGTPVADTDGHVVLLPATPGQTATTPTTAPAPEGTAQNAIQAATEQARANTQAAPVAIPQSTTYATTSSDTARTGLSPAVTALPAYAMPVQVRGRGTVLSLNGSPEARFWVAPGTGLDPANYIPARRVAPWPLPAPRVNPERRGRNAPPAPGYTVYQRFGILLVAIKNACRTEFPGLTEDQLTAVAFGFTWVVFTENGVNDGFYSWGIGNGKQYRGYPNRPWTVNPYDRSAYQAGRSFEEGVQFFIADMRRRYASSVNVLLSGVVPPELVVLLRSVNALENPYWQNVSPIRPDLFYIHLGYIGYYATERISSSYRRALIGLSRTRSQPTYHRSVTQLIAQNNVPAPGVFQREVAGVRPLFLSENAALASSTGGTAGTTTTQTDEAQAEDGDRFSKLFELYAENEYLKQRYAQRNAGANLRFNPYLVVGFPSMLFDSMRTRLHCVGYIQAVAHSAFVSAGGSSMSTTVRMSFCRTLQEFINDVKVDADRFNGRITSAPAEVIEEIRSVIQDDSQAESFYQKLFYGGAPPGSRPACFRWENAMGYAQGIAGQAITIEGDTHSVLAERSASEANTPETTPTPQAPETSTASVESIFGLPGNTSSLDLATRLREGQGLPPGVGNSTVTVVPPTPPAAPAQPAQPATQGDRNAESAGVQASPPPAPPVPTAPAPTAPATTTPARNNLDPNRELSPRLNTAYANAFDNYHIAMQLAARPVCTLEQYIRFWHGGRTINDLLGARLIAEPRNDFSYTTRQHQDITRRNADGTNVTGTTRRPSAQFYGRIFRLRLGPGEAPAEGERGYTTGPNIQPSETNVGVDKAYPETRANWDEMLIEYRNRVRQLLNPST